MMRTFGLNRGVCCAGRLLLAAAAIAIPCGQVSGAEKQAAARIAFGDDQAGTPGHERAALGITLGPSTIGGVTIAGVMPNSPAAEAGLRPGDVLFSIDGVAVGSTTDVVNFIAAHEPGDGVQLTLDRNGLRGTLSAVLSSQHDVAKRAALGVTLSKSAFGGGVRILQIVSGSPADKAGLKIGDRIVAIDDEPVTSYGELIRLIGESVPGGDLKIGVDRYGLEGTLHASLTGLPQVFSLPRPTARPLVQPPAPPLFELAPSDIDDQRGYGD